MLSVTGNSCRLRFLKGWGVFLFSAVLSAGYAQTPVLLRVVGEEQHDTVGFNIVNDIREIAYNHILSGKKFWDSPQKEIPITATTLKEIERSSETSFLKQPVIYIYEFWSGTGKNLKSVTTGFGFFNKTKSGEEVSYGYLDYKDIQDVLFSTPVHANANGNFNTTVAYCLSGKNYYYHILQFGARPIDNLAGSERIKNEVTGGDGRFPNAAAGSNEILRKLVTFSMGDIAGPDTARSIRTRSLLEAVEEYLKANNEVFFNLGGDKVMTHIKGTTKIAVTRLEVKELWKKIGGEISYDPVAVTIYVNDTPLNEILYKDMVRMDIPVGLKTWIDCIREKDFTYIIQSVNDQDIKRSEAYLYLKALQHSDWQRLTEYVKSF